MITSSDVTVPTRDPRYVPPCCAFVNPVLQAHQRPGECPPTDHPIAAQADQPRSGHRSFPRDLQSQVQGCRAAVWLLTLPVLDGGHVAGSRDRSPQLHSAQAVHRHCEGKLCCALLWDVVAGSWS